MATTTPPSAAPASRRPIILPSRGVARVKNVLSGDTVVLLGKPSGPNEKAPEVVFTLENISAPRYVHRVASIFLFLSLASISTKVVPCLLHPSHWSYQRFTHRMKSIDPKPETLNSFQHFDSELHLKGTETQMSLVRFQVENGFVV